MFKTGRIYQAAYAILKPMKGGNKARGFTIVETLIVLAVTGALFAAIAVTLSGRQQKTQFQQAINNVHSQIQEVINEVSTGFYPNTGNFTCDAAATGPVFTATPSPQGENPDCTFIGKVMQFGVGTNDPEQFNVYSLAGLRRDSSGNEVRTYGRPNSTAAEPSVLTRPGTVQANRLQYGLSTLRVTYPSSAANASAFAFVNSLEGASLSGAQQVRLLPVRGITLGMTQSAAQPLINSYFKGNNTNNPDADITTTDSVSICFVSGGTDQSGLITIGSNGRQLSVTLAIKGNRTCA